METPGNSSGFSPHVWNRLNEMAQQSAPRGRGGRHRGYSQTRAAWVHQDQEEQYHPDSQQHASSFTANPASFPPLGTQPPPRGRGTASYQPRSQYPSESQLHNFNDGRHGTPREYQERARGYYRGSRSSGLQQRRPQHHVHSSHQPHFSNAAAFHTDDRIQTRHHGQLYNPNESVNFDTAQQQRSMRHLISAQADYLTAVGRKAYEVHKFRQEERDVKETFRRTLESIARRALGAEYPNLKQEQVKLKCYGSLANGFALAGSDMDLLLSLPDLEASESAVNLKTNSQPKIAPDDRVEDQDFKIDTGRILEKAFLDHEYGARLITQTRVPILRICQNPTPDLLRNLRETRAAWEVSRGETGVVESDLPHTSDEPPTELDSVEQALTDLNLGEARPAKQERRGNEGLEFTEDCGIQCDINFSNFVALHNSAMLRLYQDFDPRVREIGVFVKIWAKTRDINTPYRGTLSSYGWILMVLHYLMNVARPPVIPNLQYLAKIDDAWNPGRAIELFEGFDIRFVQDPDHLKEIREDMAANPNKESAGQLLRGFFQYYATYQGFHWTRDVISIRTKGGIISKQAKGWTEAKWQQTQTKSVRLRYLVAIEDPFEIEHNVARTVGHHGIIAIRDEFRRAWSIISTVGTDQEIPVEPFLSPVTERVDTLKKDLESRRERQMQMRQELEAKEKAMLRKRDGEFPDPLTDGTLGDSDLGNPETCLPEESERWPSKSKLTSTTYPQDRNPRLKPKRRVRKVLVESDDEEDSTTHAHANAKEQEKIADIAPLVKAEPKDASISVSDVPLVSGYDHEGNLVAWDIDTQDGRWLHWRDQKARKGILRPFLNPNLRKLNEECPFDPRRPDPHIGKPYSTNSERKKQYQRPPWPSSSGDGASKGRVAPDQLHSAENKGIVAEIEGDAQIPDKPEADVRTKVAESCVADIHEKSKVTSSGNMDNKPAQRHDPTSVVGLNIPWDRNTAGGRWLRQRDARIRAGKWEHHPGSRYAQIDLAFPYKPEMIWKELEELNQQLRQYYKRAVFDAKQPDLLSRRMEQESCDAEVNDQAPSSVATQKATIAMQAESQMLTQHMAAAENGSQRGSRSLVDSSSAHINVFPDKPPSPDSHPSRDSASDRVPITPLDESGSPDLDFLRTQRLAFFSKFGSSPNGDANTNIQFYPKAAIASEALELVDEPLHTFSPSRQRLAEEVSEVGDSSYSLEAKGDSGKVDNLSHHPDYDLSAAFESEGSQGTEGSSLEVPATLCPNLDSSSRPRHEDPNILPIPRTTGFRFDPRQLEDLAVIARGGNGCARAGAQFHIEEEYEWGGGGMMGWKTSTGPQLDGMSGCHTPFEAGRGDEQGLLAELPRDVD